MEGGIGRVECGPSDFPFSPENKAEFGFEKKFSISTSIKNLVYISQE